MHVNIAVYEYSCVNMIKYEVLFACIAQLSQSCTVLIYSGVSF